MASQHDKKEAVMYTHRLAFVLSLLAGAMPAAAQVPSCQLVLASTQGLPDGANHLYIFHGICTPAGGSPFWVDGKATWTGSMYQASEQLTINEGSGGLWTLKMKCLHIDPWLPVGASGKQATYDFTECIKLSEESSSAAFPKGSDPLPGFAGMDLVGGTASRAASDGGSRSAPTGRTAPQDPPPAQSGTLKMSDQKKLQTNMVVDSIRVTVPPPIWGPSTSVLLSAPPGGQLSAGEARPLASGTTLVLPAGRGASLQLVNRKGRVLKTFPSGAELRQLLDGTLLIVAGRDVYPIPQPVSGR
jgi:hypothetical protein